MIKAIIFDFDGVLVESVDIKTKAFSELFSDYGPGIVEKIIQHHLAHGGISRYEKIKFYYREYLNVPLSPEELNKLCQEFSALVLQKVIHAPFVSGAMEFLKNNSQKYNLFIVSGTPHEEMVHITQAKGMHMYFMDIFGSPTVKGTHIQNILLDHGLKGKEVVFVGDSITDYRAARTTSVNFLGRVAPRDNNPFTGDVITIPDLNDLNNCIKHILKKDVIV